MKVLGGGIEGGLGVVLVVLRDLEIPLRNGSVLKEQLCSIQLLAREQLIGDSLAVGIKASRNIVASNTQQELALLNCVTEASADIDDAAGGKRNHRDSSRDVRKYGAGHEH